MGSSPFGELDTVRVKTYIVPLVIRTHRIATSVDLSTFDFTTAAGDVTLDPTVADSTCMVAPNNVPLTVVRQSPLFEPTKFNFGAVDVGTTQYIDANQRASFWKVLGADRDNYHVLLDPVRITEPVILDVPANEGLAITNPSLFSALGPFCAPLQIIDTVWFESYLNGTVIPGLSQVNRGSLPIFLAYNGFWTGLVALGGIGNLLNCCQTGAQFTTGTPRPTQTGVYATFDRTGFFGGPSAGLDFLPLSEVIGGWANDPYFLYATPLWCPAFGLGLQVGTVMTGAARPPVTMPNGYPYYLQEFAFFSWFFGGSSLGVNGWYSNNGTFLAPNGPCP